MHNPMSHTIIAFSIARRESDSDRYSAIATGVTRDQALATFAHDGVARSTASTMLDDAVKSALRPGARLVDGDSFEHVRVGPRNESYKLRATSLRIDPIGDPVPAAKPAPKLTDYVYEDGARVIPVYVAGNATIHAGRERGTYASGAKRYRKLCSSSSNDRHDPMPVADATTPVTCKRCLAKLR